MTRVAFAHPGSPLLQRFRCQPCFPVANGMSMTSQVSSLPKIVDVLRKCAQRTSRLQRPLNAVNNLSGPAPATFVPHLSKEEVLALESAVRDIDPRELGADSLIASVGETSRQSDLSMSLSSVPIGFCHIGRIENVADFAIFLLPPGKRIPIHDHPHMHVFTRVLSGRMRVDEFNADAGQDCAGLLTVRSSMSEMETGDVRVLTPQAGNIHSFSGIEWTAVFDVSVPPYEEEQGRSCGYYTPVDRTLEVTTPEQAVYLLKTECPSDYITTNVPYSGDPLPL